MAGEVRVRVTADTSGLRKGMEESGEHVEKFSRGVKKAGRDGREFAEILGSLGGVSGEAGHAIGALTAGLSGGVFGLAAAGVAILVNHFKAAGEAAEAAKKKADEFGESLTKKVDEALQKFRVLTLVQGGMTEAQAKQVVAEQDAISVQRLALVQLEEARNKVDELKKASEAEAAARKAGSFSANAWAVTYADEIAAAEEEVRRLESTIQSLGTVAEGMGAEATTRSTEALRKAAEKAEADRLEAARKATAAYGKLMNERGAQYLAELKKETDATEKAEREKARAGQAALDARARKHEKDEQTADQKAKARASDNVGYAQALGEAYVESFARARTGAEALGGVFKSTIGTIIDVIEKQVLADAVAAAAEAYKSQAGIPVVGPLLGAGAAAAAFASVRALLGKLPGREHGGEVQAGRSYIVGEKRPEVFTPNVSGRIEPSVPSGGGSHFTFNISAMDGANVESVIRRNIRGMERELRNARRLGRAV